VRHRLPLVLGIFVAFAALAAGDEKGKESDKKWKVIAPTDGVSFAMPGEPKEVEQEVGGIKVKIWALEPNNGSAYLVGYNKLPAAPAEKDIPEKLEVAAKGQFSGVGGDIRKTTKIKLGDKYPGLECEGTFSKGGLSGSVKTRIYLVGDSMFQVLALGEKEFVESKESKRFFESLKLKEK
jgi:hypothetical protein